jgi:TRAP-type C4-dicarboxylate transport system permease small subunit
VDPATAPTAPDGSADPPLNLREFGLEDWLAFALFWLLAIVVFLQFFTRYVLNDSLAWTEEIARYLLTMVAFVGGGMAIRRYTHIHVEFLYVYLPRSAALILSALVDLARIAFLLYGTWLAWEVTRIMETQRMVIIDWPMSIVFGVCTLGLAIMALRAIEVSVRSWRARSNPLVRAHVEGRHQ